MHWIRDSAFSFKNRFLCLISLKIFCCLITESFNIGLCTVIFDFYSFLLRILCRFIKTMTETIVHYTNDMHIEVINRTSVGHEWTKYFGFQFKTYHRCICTTEIHQISCQCKCHNLMQHSWHLSLTNMVFIWFWKQLIYYGLFVIKNFS